MGSIRHHLTIGIDLLAYLAFCHAFLNGSSDFEGYDIFLKMIDVWSRFELPLRVLNPNTIFLFCFVFYDFVFARIWSMKYVNILILLSTNYTF